MSLRRRICIVLLIGIPGSGKSYFRTFLERFLDGYFESVLGSVQICSLCYDNYSNIRNPSKSCSWKKERLDLVNVVKNITSYFKTHSFGAIGEEFSSAFPGLGLINGHVEKPDSNLIVIDDNMYYKSMRYEYYKLAKILNVSFSQVFLKIDLLEALECNSRRISGQVPSGVIKAMYSKIEPPNKRHAWEMNSISVPSYSNFENSQVLKEILLCIKCSLENPVMCVELGLHKQEANSNALHSIDNALKQIVNVYIKSKVNECNKNELLELSKLFSKKRLNLLKQIKEGSIDLNLDLSNLTTLEHINSIKPMLLSLLSKDL